MVLLLPHKRKFFTNLKDNFNLNSIKSNDEELELITIDLFSGSSKNEAVLYFNWCELGLMQRVSPEFQNVFSMKSAISNYFISHGGTDKNKTNQIILFNEWNSLIHCLSMFFENPEFKWTRREDGKNDIGLIYIISKSNEDSNPPFVTKQTHLFNTTFIDSSIHSNQSPDIKKDESTTAATTSGANSGDNTTTATTKNE